MIRYDPLWKTMKARGVSQYKLLKDYHFSAGQLSRLRKNENVSTYTLNTLCSILNCRIEDVAVYRPDTVPTAPEDASPESTGTNDILEHALFESTGIADT